MSPSTSFESQALKQSLSSSLSSPSSDNALPSSSSTSLSILPEPSPKSLPFCQVYEQSQSSSSLSSTASTSRKKEIVLIFSWLGGKRRTVSKYSQWYYKNGYDVIQICTEKIETLASREPYSTRFKQVLAIAEQIHLENMNNNNKNNKSNKKEDQSKEEKQEDDQLPELIFHSFSNGGLRYYIEFIRILQDEFLYFKWRKKLRGSIIDSAPSHINPSSISKAFTGNYPAGITRTIVRGVVYTIGTGLSFYSWMNGESSNTSFGMDWFVDGNKSWHHSVPIFYIYSTSDDIAESWYIDEVVETQRSQGRKVKVLKFDETKHVQHMTSKPEYFQQIESFIEEVAESEQNLN